MYRLSTSVNWSNFIFTHDCSFLAIDTLGISIIFYFHLQNFYLNKHASRMNCIFTSFSIFNHYSIDINKRAL